MKNEINNEAMKLEFRRLEGYSEKELLALILVELKGVGCEEETDPRSSEDIREMEEETVSPMNRKTHYISSLIENERRVNLVDDESEPESKMWFWMWFWIICILLSTIALVFVHGIPTGLGWINLNERV